MLLPQTYFATLLLMICSMLCWGSWANTYKITGKWRFELFYFDYAIGVLAASLILGFTAGSFGFDGFSFLDSLMSVGKRQMLFAFLGGVVFNLANMLLVAAIAVAGMAVAFPVGIGTALVIGVVLNYIIDAKGNPILLFSGCGVIVAAIIIDALAYRALGLLRHEQLAKTGKAPTRRSAPIKGIVISIVSGILMGLFYPLVAKSQTGDLAVMFTPYAVGFVFALGVFFTTPLFNMFFMNLPVEGDPVEFTDYFKGNFRQHFMGWLGGAIWCLGTVSNFVAAAAPTQVGPATSYAMGQGATMVSALWGILVWKEFRGADTRVKSLLIVMLVLFVCGLALVAQAPLYDKVP
jgi:glucose uptake protein